MKKLLMLSLLCMTLSSLRSSPLTITRHKAPAPDAPEGYTTTRYHSDDPIVHQELQSCRKERFSGPWQGMGSPPSRYIWEKSCVESLKKKYPGKIKEKK
ncbi:MAG: hypothetical protein WD055_00555 [Candidatus Dependentiae bacterium]